MSTTSNYTKYKLIINLLKDELTHGVIATPLALAFYFSTGLVSQCAAIYIATYLIDIDHLFDYYKYHGFKFKIKNIVGGNYFYKSKKAYVILHSWELIIVLVVVGIIQGVESYLLAVGLAMAVHVFYDVFSYKNKIQLYSLVYRLTHNFDN